MKRITALFLVFLFILIFHQSARAQLKGPPRIEWQRSLGGSNGDAAYSIQQTRDGGYITAGLSTSTDGDVTGNHGYQDYWIVKLNDTGAIQWQKSLGGSFTDEARSIQQTHDGGYIVSGTSSSNNNDVTGNHGGYDYWVVKIDSSGVIQWQKTLGGSEYDYCFSIQQTRDSGYVVAGSSKSKNGDVLEHYDEFDLWIVKLNMNGAIEWQLSLGGHGNESANSIEQTEDGGYIVAGSTYGYHLSQHSSGRDYLIVKFDVTGTIQWQRFLGGTNDDEALCIRQTRDGGYIAAGRSNSNDSDVTGNHGDYDYWVVKLNATGTIQWERSLGGTYVDEAHSIQQIQDGGYIVAGISFSNDGDVTGNYGNGDYWIVKLNDTGSIQWQKALGGGGGDVAFSIQQTRDQGFIVAGASTSNDGNVSGQHGNRDTADFWIVKLSPESTNSVESESVTTPNISITPNPASTSATLTLDSDEAGACEIQIISVTGATLKEYSTRLTTGKQEIALTDLESLPSGMYEVLVKRSGHQSLRTKFIVQ